MKKINTQKKLYQVSSGLYRSKCIDPDGTPMYSIRRLKRFIRKTQARYSYTCMVGSCRRTFNNLSEMQLHQRSHQKLRPFKCPHCPKLYTQKGNMVKHRRSHLIPNLDDRRRFICEFCHKGYTEKYNLKVRFSSDISNCVDPPEEVPLDGVSEQIENSDLRDIIICVLKVDQ
ncbi:unnamed protein product [Moneuplotes crassus]|uniref:C2H2-type domain-containing protein n=1 Tax=Euplotes crassus TaxID=5936 RepID=A0AAD1X7D3_EUPCR|nr:unnamed protein product [Moneuplotes crassus]